MRREELYLADMVDSSAGEGLTRQWGCITLVQPVKALHLGEIQSEPKPQSRYNGHQIVYFRLAAT